ncbi:MAG: acetate kinase, partial [Bacilli bacterium]|nr:acetate kinase [Bacilli bacterium]
YICKEKNMTYEEVTNILNKKSGFLGISGKNDYRDVNKLANEGNENAILAIKMFEKSVLRYIYQYYGELEGNIDALVFTAGLAENNPSLRENIVNSLSKISNVSINKELNNKIAKYLELQEGKISTPDSKYDVFVLPTDEEYMILKDTYNIVNKVLIKK